MTESDQVTVAVAAERTGIPARTIRAWTKPTSDRAPLLHKTGQLVSLAEVERVRRETGYKQRKRRPREHAIGAKEFARRVGRKVATVYGWRQAGVITAYTAQECERMLAAVATKDAGGAGLEEQALVHGANVERADAGPTSTRNVATPAEINYLRKRRLEREERVAEGKLYVAKDAEATIAAIAAQFRQGVDRLAIDIPRVVAAELDLAGVALDPHLRARLSGAVLAATVTVMPDIQRSLRALRDRHVQ